MYHEIDICITAANRWFSVALIKCGECGKEVSDKAQACPNCGSPIASLNVTLVLTGFPRRYIGSKAVDVFFNGELKNSVEKGSTVTVTLPGAGQVDFVTHYMGRERRQSFDVPAGLVADLHFDFTPLGGLKVLEAGSGSGTFYGYTMEMPGFGD